MLLTAHLKKQGVLTKLCERVQFARRRFGRYDVINFVTALFGYAITWSRCWLLLSSIMCQKPRC